VIEHVQRKTLEGRFDRLPQERLARFVKETDRSLALCYEYFNIREYKAAKGDGAA
jgi:hypothetical protein